MKHLFIVGILTLFFTSCKKEKITCNCTSTNTDFKITQVVETTYNCSEQTFLDTINNQAQRKSNLPTQTTCIEQ